MQFHLGFTLVELIVVMAIVGLLISLALPALGKARASAQRVGCVNNLKNIGLGVQGFEVVHSRLPATGFFYDSLGVTGLHHSWVVQILPHVDQANLYNSWNFDLPITDPVNEPLTRTRMPLFICPVDITRSTSEEPQGDLSYVVNGGIGSTMRFNDVPDCPIAYLLGPVDLDADGSICPAVGEDEEDKKYFKGMCLFFIENWKSPGGTSRFHSLGDIRDGTSQTFMVSENYRVGYSPDDPRASFASPLPSQAAFHVGFPCTTVTCLPGTVDYTRSNAGDSAINSGRSKPEGESPVPNSFHVGGVNMAYADGHVAFLNEDIDGRVYAALSSPQGTTLYGTPLEQQIISGGF